MGQLCFKDEQVVEPTYEKKQRLQSTMTVGKKSFTNTVRYTYAEDVNVQNISRDIKITLKQNVSGDNDTEDENYQAGKSCTEESVNSEATISHHRNNDQVLDDISPKNDNIVSDTLAVSKAKSNSSKHSNITKKTTKNSLQSAQIFTGTLGHNSYLDMSSQGQYAYTEDYIGQVTRKKRIRSETQTIKQQHKQQQKESILSDKP